MFSDDNIASHLDNLFDHYSETYSVSANTYVSVCVGGWLCACVAPSGHGR